MSKLYIHENHPHQPRTITREDVHEAHKARGGLNAAIAILLTKSVATMWAAYIFAALALAGFPGLHTTPQAYVQWISQTFIQLVMLSVIMVGQGLLGKHAEMVSEETAATTQKNYHQLGQLVRHLNAQDEVLQQQLAELLKQTKILIRLQKKATGD